MAARIFLYIVAILIVLALLAAVAWNQFQNELIAWALVPDAPVEQLAEVDRSRYSDPAMWLARPDIADDPTEWLPQGYRRAQAERERLPVFYVVPTAYLDNDRWNAPFRSPATLERQRLFAASQASVFTGVGEVWAPLYRQAVVGAFLTDAPSAAQALEFAYRDVATAFDYFVSRMPEGQRFILAGHSQGARHLTQLLRRKIAGTPLADRVAAAYLIGWPISIEADLPAMGLPGCAAPSQSNCIIAFQSFAEPANPRRILALYGATRGFTGALRADTPMLCVNPLTGSREDAAGAEANRGALVPEEGLERATLKPARIPARCDARGFLLIGAPPEGYDRYVLPGNNYHVFDFMLFWRNLRDDVARRVAAHAR
ncbi:MAG: DUF3089 domain-containing protein [Sphingomonadaceae bacterium]|nr:DUF3089 domain-containing protein [Sphingomonadaceae bacterium]